MEIINNDNFKKRQPGQPISKSPGVSYAAKNNFTRPNKYTFKIITFAQTTTAHI